MEEIKKFYMSDFLIGTAIGIAFTLLVFLVSSAVISFSEIPQTITEIIVICGSICGVIIAGVLSARRAVCHGWLYGGISGIMYMIILALAALAITGHMEWAKSLISAVVGFVTGSVGGIIGINLRANKKKKW